MYFFFCIYICTRIIQSALSSRPIFKYKHSISFARFQTFVIHAPLVGYSLSYSLPLLLRHNVTSYGIRYEKLELHLTKLYFLRRKERLSWNVISLLFGQRERSTWHDLARVFIVLTFCVLEIVGKFKTKFSLSTEAVILFNVYQ